jgi:hypothetical protein
LRCAGATLGGRFVEDDDFGFERGDCQAVAVTGGLGRMDETLDGGACVGNETKVVDVEKDVEEGHGVRVRESQVGMVSLDGVNEVGDVETPEEGRETTAFRQSFEDLDVGGVVGETVEDTVHEGVVECANALPEVLAGFIYQENSNVNIDTVVYYESMKRKLI